MTGNIIRFNTLATQRFKISYACCYKRRLSIHCLFQVTVRPLEDQLAQRKSEHLVTLLEYGTALRQCVIYILPHPDYLRTLAGKDKCDFTHFIYSFP
ncbi:hypothetical protein D3C73_929420 [compost metagenome]